MLKTAVIGASGYVGSHLWQSYRSHFPDCIGTGFSASHPELRPFDIRQPNIESLQLAETGYQAVLIAAAKPNVAYCENNKDAAYDVNVRGTLELARQLGKIGLPVIFLSSDYVFAGSSGPYRDTDPIGPTTEYGRHKALVERELPGLVERYMVLRLSKIYGTRRGDKTLLDEMAGLLASHSEICAAKDQMFCPTYVGDLPAVIHGLQATNAKGTLNLCSPDGYSRFEIASTLADAMGADRNLVKAVSLHDLPTMASRPLDTRMLPSKIVTDVGSTFTTLQQSIRKVTALWAT